MRGHGCLKGDEDPLVGVLDLLAYMGAAVLERCNYATELLRAT